jgi:hypothetical protein
MVRTSGYEYLKLVYGLFWHKLPAESVKTQRSYIIIQVNDMYRGGSEALMS